MSDTFRVDVANNVLWVGERFYPMRRFTRDNGLEDIPDAANFLADHPTYRMYSRQAIVPCENTWLLSVIWGDSTYSTNHWGLGPQRPFVEEPATVEVGILAPSPRHVEARTFDFGVLPEPLRKVEMPAYDTDLWCDPLSYVTTDEFHQLVACISRLPSKDYPPGPDSETTYTVEAVCDYIQVALMEQRL